MRKRFEAMREDRPGAAWLARFGAGRVEAEAWYRGGNPADVPDAAECRAALGRHMPELLGGYDHVCGLVGDDPMAHRILSQYRPPPMVSGCSQAVWLGQDGPALVRNYDFPLDVVSPGIEATCWSGRRVIAKAQRPWGGCLDGMNEDGLVASLTHGGGTARGQGFAIILLLRYVLETCSTVDEAVAALCRLPLAQSQNVMLLDRSGAHATLFLGPDRAPAVTRLRVCTNHQERPASGDSTRRGTFLEQELVAPGMDLPRLVQSFLSPPLYSRAARFTTVYTAIYRPAEGRVTYLWPGHAWEFGFDAFAAGDHVHDYGELIG